MIIFLANAPISSLLKINNPPHTTIAIKEIATATGPVRESAKVCRGPSHGKPVVEAIKDGVSGRNKRAA